MDLRGHIDLALATGSSLRDAVVVNYVMGKGHESRERDLSQLKKKELKILFDEKLITKKQYDKHIK